VVFSRGRGFSLGGVAGRVAWCKLLGLGIEIGRNSTVASATCQRFIVGKAYRVAAVLQAPTNFSKIIK